jgi:hypothetical protein
MKTFPLILIAPALILNTAVEPELQWFFPDHDFKQNMNQLMGADTA